MWEMRVLVGTKTCKIPEDSGMRQVQMFGIWVFPKIFVESSKVRGAGSRTVHSLVVGYGFWMFLVGNLCVSPSFASSIFYASLSHELSRDAVCSSVGDNRLDLAGFDHDI